MTPHMPVPETAEAVRRLNSQLDEALLAELDGIDISLLRTVPSRGEWSISQLAAHVAEFPLFFAGELRRWFDDRTTVVGRTHDHPDRQHAIEHPVANLEEMWAAIARSLHVLATALEPLEDHDLVAMTTNVRYGHEPLSAFLDRYVIGHKQEHLAQLRATKTAVTR